MKLEMRTASGRIVRPARRRAAAPSPEARELAAAKKELAEQVVEACPGTTVAALSRLRFGVLRVLAAKVTERTPRKPAPTGDGLPERTFDGFAWIYTNDDTPAKQYAAEGRWHDRGIWKYSPPPDAAA